MESGVKRRQTLFDLTITLDPKDLTYPIVIDPTVSIYNNSAVENTYVQSNYPNTISWNQRALWVGYEDGYYTSGKDKGYTRTYLRFPNVDTVISPSVPANNAHLYLYKYAGPHLKYGDSGARIINLYDVDSSWNGDNTTWNTQPALGTYRQYANLSTANGYYTWAIQPLVQEWVNRTHSNYGMCLKMWIESATCDIFYQAYTPFANYPYLYVDWGESVPPTVAIQSNCGINGRDVHTILLIGVLHYLPIMNISNQPKKDVDARFN